jgi:chromosome segregation ATPase
MRGSERRSWLPIGVALIAVALGALALIVALNAKGTGEDAATQAELNAVSNELSNLVDRLGIAEASLTGRQSELQDRANHAVKQSRSAVANLSERIDRLERQTAALDASAKQAESLGRAIDSLQAQIKTVDGQIARLNQRVTMLAGRVHGASASGGQSAP